MKKKTTTIIVTRDGSDGEGMAWESSAKLRKDNFGEYGHNCNRLFYMGCATNDVFKTLFPSRPRKGQKKKYRATVEEL